MLALQSQSQEIPNWIYMLISCGCCIGFMALLGSIWFFVVYNNPAARLGRAVEHRISTPSVRHYHKTTVVKPPDDPEVALKRLEVTQWVIGIVALAGGVVLLFVFAPGDIPLLVITAAAELVIEILKAGKRKLIGGTTDIQHK